MLSPMAKSSDRVRTVMSWFLRQWRAAPGSASGSAGSRSAGTECSQPHQGPVGRLGNALNPDDMVFLDQQLRGREDGIDEIGRAPQRPAFLRLRDHGVEPGARQDGTDVCTEDPVARQVILEERADRVPVGDAEMVGFEAALEQDFPVRRPLPGLLVDNLEAVGAEPGEIPRQTA